LFWLVDVWKRLPGESKGSKGFGGDWLSVQLEFVSELCSKVALNLMEAARMGVVAGSLDFNRSAWRIYTKQV
jgi:hypothetical protein